MKKISTLKISQGITSATYARHRHHIFSIEIFLLGDSPTYVGKTTNTIITLFKITATLWAMLREMSLGHPEISATTGVSLENVKS